MALTAWVGKERYEIGSVDFLKAFFSTVFVRLEEEDWGRRFPAVMSDFYSGRLSHRRSKEAVTEIETIRQELKKHPPADVVWDFEDRAKRPPWGDAISDHIKDLSNYFVTSDGKNLIDVLVKAFARAGDSRRDVEIH